jgi:DNA-binding SARP family transcriptional activator
VAPCIALAPDALIQLDSHELEASLAAGTLAEAVALYRGDFLDGSPAFEQWMLLERERLRTLGIAAYQQLITQTTTSGQREQAIGSTECLLHLDPLDIIWNKGQVHRSSRFSVGSG